jgi:hypothetical protein
MEVHAINPEATLLVSGEIDDWAAIHHHRVDTIVDMDGDIDPGVPEVPNQLLYIYFPILDEDLPCLTKLEALARFIADLVCAGHVVLVHCRMGVNRSNLLAAAALTYLGMTGCQALEHLRGINPAALFNETFAAHVQSLPARGITARERS